MVRKLVTFMTAGLLMITPIAANALGFGAIKLNSALNERFDADVEILSPTPEDIRSLKVDLASEPAFLRAGIERTATHNSLFFEVKQRPNDTYYIHISSRGALREPFLNFLLEMAWKNGRMLREYTVLLDPPALKQQAAQQPAVIETPATAEPEAVAQVEAPAEPFVPAPLAQPVIETPAEEMVSAEQFPRVDLTEYKETGAEEAPQQVVSKEPPPALKHEAAPPAEPAMVTEPEPAPLPEPTAADMVAESEPFAEQQLFPTIPLTSYGEEAAVTGMTGELDYGITTKNDNLWNIAEKMRPSEDVSIYQVMMALVQANPDAFVDGNVHRLKVGHVLRIDDPSLFSAMTKQQAANEYQAQTSEWSEYRQAAAGRVSEQPVIATQVESETAIAAPESKGELTLASPEGSELKSGAGVSEDAISNDLATLKAELDQMREQASATQGRNEALNSRIRELEDQLADMQRTISIKDDELAALQQQLKELNQQPAVSPEAEPEPQPQPQPAEEVAQPVAVEEAPAEVAEAPAEERAEEEPEAQEPVAAAEAEPVSEEESPVAIADRIAKEEAAKPEPAKKPTPAKEEGVMDMVMGMLGETGKVVSNIGAAIGGVLGGGMTMYIVIAAVALILLFSLVVFKRRKQGENFQESILKGTPSAAPAGASDVPSADLSVSEESSFLSDFAVSGAGAIHAEDSEVDPLTEADVFMAYGRYEAAEERLQEAIQSEPDRQELKLKLLELYNTTQNAPAFENTAEDIYASLGGDTAGNPTWEKVVALGQQILPNNPLFSGEAAAKETSAPAPAAQEEKSAELTDSQVMDIGLETGAFNTEDFSAADVGAETAESAAVDEFDFNLDSEMSSEQTAQAQEEPAAMDFDLDLGESTAEVEAPDFETAAAGEAAAMEAGEEMDSLDFDLDLGEPGSEVPAAAEAETGDDMASLDFDLDMGESAAETPAEQAQPAEEAAEMDFNLDMDTGSTEQPAEAEAETDSTMMMDVGEGLELDLDTESAGQESESMDLGLDASDAADLDMPSEGDEVGTKLDLAKAYIDMGDPDGARSILDEVLDEGNDQQKAEAEQLMQQIA